MSAFLCDAATLAAIAREAATLDAKIDAERVFDLLLDTNLKSIGSRYPDAARISDWFDAGEAAFIWENIPEATHTATELRDMVKSYRYQSCEFAEWPDSLACRLTDALLIWLEPRAEAEAKAERQQKAERRAALDKLPTLGSKETAAAIRKVLKRAFPATKFSVVTERGSMVTSVRIAWTDGPTPARVDALVKCFKAGSFDGMTDCYEYDRDTVLKIDGVTYRPACKYVFTSRTISTTLARKAAALVANYYGLEVPAIVDKGNWFQVDASQVNAPQRKTGHDWHSLIHQAAGDRSRFTPDTVTAND